LLIDMLLLWLFLLGGCGTRLGSSANWRRRSLMATSPWKGRGSGGNATSGPSVSGAFGGGLAILGVVSGATTPRGATGDLSVIAGAVGAGLAIPGAAGAASADVGDGAAGGDPRARRGAYDSGP